MFLTHVCVRFLNSNQIYAAQVCLAQVCWSPSFFRSSFAQSLVNQKRGRDRPAGLNTKLKEKQTSTLAKVVNTLSTVEAQQKNVCNLFHSAWGKNPYISLFESASIESCSCDHSFIHSDFMSNVIDPSPLTFLSISIWTTKCSDKTHSVYRVKGPCYECSYVPVF